MPYDAPLAIEVTPELAEGFQQLLEALPDNTVAIWLSKVPVGSVIYSRPALKVP